MEMLLVFLTIFILFEILTCLGMGLIFKKKNLDFKKGIIPFYNKIILIKHYKLPQFHMLLTFIPIINMFTNFCIYKKLAEQYKKGFIDILELTFFPFIFNIFLGLEIKQESKEQAEDFFENQKELYNKNETEEEINNQKEEYNWFPKPKIKSDTVYKASRNSLNAKVNINIQANDEIIDNKSMKQKENNNLKTCPKCGAKVPKNIETCFICGTKL